EPTILSIPVTEYPRHYPPNAFAEQDSAALLPYFPRKNKLAFQSQEGDRLLKELAALEVNKDQAVVIHLCTHALSRDKDVYLLPGDSDPDKPETWLALTKILRVVDQCPASQKLLILDIMRPVAEVRLGVLLDDVAQRVQETIQKEEPKYLI